MYKYYNGEPGLGLQLVPGSKIHPPSVLNCGWKAECGDDVMYPSTIGGIPDFHLIRL